MTSLGFSIEVDSSSEGIIYIGYPSGYIDTVDFQLEDIDLKIIDVGKYGFRVYDTNLKHFISFNQAVERIADYCKAKVEQQFSGDNRTEHFIDWVSNLDSYMDKDAMIVGLKSSGYFVIEFEV